MKHIISKGCIKYLTQFLFIYIIALVEQVSAHLMYLHSCDDLHFLFHHHQIDYLQVWDYFNVQYTVKLDIIWATLGTDETLLLNGGPTSLFRGSNMAVLGLKKSSPWGKSMLMNMNVLKADLKDRTAISFVFLTPILYFKLTASVWVSRWLLKRYATCLFELNTHCTEH